MFMSDKLSSHARLLFSSFRRVTGRTLWSPEWISLPDEELLEAFENAPCVLASHGTETDPILNYGNQTALTLWETDWEGFTAMPSRLTAEPVERSERERLLHEVSTNGYINNYSGIRVSTTGRRFLIEQATVWNVIDTQGDHRGQAVVFSEWKFL